MNAVADKLDEARAALDSARRRITETLRDVRSAEAAYRAKNIFSIESGRARQALENAQSHLVAAVEAEGHAVAALDEIETELARAEA